MAAGDVETGSLNICRRVFLEIEWDKINKICAYSAIAKLNEVDIAPLIKALEYKYPYIRITLLKQSPEQAFPKNEFDLILVPCLAFDNKNHRLGWGGGFYDRFLARQPGAFKVGLCFQNGYVPEDLPIQAHDVPLDLIITEKTAAPRP